MNTTPKPFRLKLAQTLCSKLPPIVAQRFRHYIYPKQLGVKDKFAFRQRGITGSYYSCTTNDHQGYSFSVNGYFDWRNIAVAVVICKPGDTIIEVGANVGTETIGYSDIAGPNGRVYAFEPLPSNMRKLKNGLKDAKFKNVVFEEFALAEAEKTVEFVIPSENSTGLAHIKGDSEKKAPDEVVRVYCRRLDSFIDQIPNARMIFCDTEGYDYFVVEGGKEYIRRYKPVVLVEANPKYLKRAGTSIEKLKAIFDELQYELFIIGRFAMERVDERSMRHNSNWVCIPKDQLHLVTKINGSIRSSAMLPAVPGLNPMTRTAAR